MRIVVDYLDGTTVEISKRELEEIEKILPVVEALERAKKLREKLITLLK